jgi:hypothetical protein
MVIKHDFRGNEVKISNSAQTIFALILIFAFVNCSGERSLSTTSTSSNETDAGSSFEDPVGGNIQQLSVDGSDSEIDLSDIAEDEEVVVVLYSYNDSSSNETFEVGSSINEDSVSTSMSLTDGDNTILDVTDEFHSMLRASESEFEDEPLPEENEQLNSSILFASVGSSKSFKVLNSFSSSSSYDSVTAELRYQTEYFNIYVDERDDDAMSDSDIEELAENFADMIPLEQDYFGDESDINNDGRFDCLFTRTVNELGASQGGIVTGFFYAVDLFDDSTYSISNEKEVIYLMVPDDDGDHGTAISDEFALVNILPGVLVHEYQHMINFNQHYFVEDGSAEEGWMNEGLSHLAEDIYSANSNDFMEGVGLENPARVSSYLSDISDICFSCGTSLSQRGGSYLFLRFLYDQAELGNLSNVADGKSLLQGLLSTSERGVDNIVNVVSGTSDTDAFKELLGRFSLAVYLSGTGYDDDDSLIFNSIDLRSVQDDNRGTVLSGPAIQSVTSLPFNDSLQGNSITYLQISGSTILEEGGTLSLDFGSGSDYGAYLIREQ